MNIALTTVAQKMFELCNLAEGRTNVLATYLIGYSPGLGKHAASTAIFIKFV